MSKFSKGDKARVTSVDYRDVKAGVKVGDIVTVNEDDSCVPYYVLSNGKNHPFEQSQIEHYIEIPKEITLNGATYVLKEEPKPEHEWKFGDIAIHPDYGVGIVTRVLSDDGSVYFDYIYEGNGSSGYWLNPISLTFLRRADLSV